MISDALILRGGYRWIRAYNSVKCSVPIIFRYQIASDNSVSWVVMEIGMPQSDFSCRLPRDILDH